MAWTFTLIRSRIRAKRDDLTGFTGSIVWGTDFPTGYQQVDQIFRIEHVYVQLDTNATVATRRVLLSIFEGALEVMQYRGNTTQMASQSVQYYFNPGTGFRPSTPTNFVVNEVLPSPMVMFPGDTFTVNVASGQVGDVLDDLVVEGRVETP